MYFTATPPTRDTVLSEEKMGADMKIEVQWDPLYDVCADHTFVAPLANSRTANLLPRSTKTAIQRPLDVYGVVGAYMVGMRCPSPERLIHLVHDISGIEEWEKAAVRGLEFMVSTKGSPREVARLMRESGVRRGLVVNWINQYSSDPGWREGLYTRLLDAVVPGRRIEYEEGLLRCCRLQPLEHAAHLAQLRHQVRLVLQAACGVEYQHGHSG